MPDNWRDQFQTGREQFRYVFKNNLFSDVRFLVGNDQTPVYSHSLVLKVRSVVFEKLLEKLQGPVREIVIEDVPTSGFKRFIQFLYIDQLEASADEALEVLPLAKKYRVSELARQCIALIKEGLGENNAISIFQVARGLKEIELEQKALEFIQNNSGQVFSGQDYLNLTIDNWSYFLKMDELDIKEIDLFQALISWGKSECTRHTLRPTPKNLRMVLKDTLYLVRFPILTLEEFNSKVLSLDILNDKEVKEISRYLEANAPDKEFVKPSLFSTSSRGVVSDQIDLSKTDDETHKRLAKLAISKSNLEGNSAPMIVTNLILEVIPRDSKAELEELIKEITKIKKFGLFWGATNEVVLPNGDKKLRISFAADIRRSYGVGTVVESLIDMEDLVAQAFVHSYKEEIVVRV